MKVFVWLLLTMGTLAFASEEFPKPETVSTKSGTITVSDGVSANYQSDSYLGADVLLITEVCRSDATETNSALVREIEKLATTQYPLGLLAVPDTTTGSLFSDWQKFDLHTTDGGKKVYMLSVHIIKQRGEKDQKNEGKAEKKKVPVFLGGKDGITTHQPAYYACAGHIVEDDSLFLGGGCVLRVKFDVYPEETSLYPAALMEDLIRGMEKEAAKMFPWGFLVIDYADIRHYDLTSFMDEAYKYAVVDRRTSLLPQSVSMLDTRAYVCFVGSIASRRAAKTAGST